MDAKVKQVLFPLLAAMIAGSAFVAQKGGAAALGAFSFTWARHVFAALSVLAFVKLREKRNPLPEKSEAERMRARKDLARAGLVAGTLIAMGTVLTQYGVKYTTAGKAGFITALYVVIVPLLGLFLRKRVRAVVWCGVAAALAGLYFLSFDRASGLIFSKGDVYLLLSALGFSLHLLSIDYYTKQVDGVKLSCVQLAVAAAETFVCALLFEGFPLRAMVSCLPQILYVGVLLGGVAYTLQILAQKDGDPTVVSLVLSLESLFAAVSGAVFLHERLSPRECLGCALMLCAVILVQLPEKHGDAA